MLAAQGSKLMLFCVEQFGGDALGMLRGIGDKKALVAIFGINASPFDIMPSELRAHSEVLLSLENDAQLDEFTLDADKALPHPVNFEKSSSRYPLRTVIRFDKTALSIWNSEAYRPAMAVSLALSVLFGVLLAGTWCTEGPVADLDRGSARGEFTPYFQPIFDRTDPGLQDPSAVAARGRFDGPANELPFAESSGRIQGMTWQILGRALSDLQPHLKADKEFKLSFNVVPKHLLSAGFVDTLRSTVAAARFSARQIVVEVTERDELDDLARAAAVVIELRDYGFRVAIDDVGVGHSGLSRLKGLGANTIKIDKFFVDTITVDASTTTIVEMLVALARDLHMTVVAEGVETGDQVRALIACGVDEGQGYLVAPPLPSKKFIELLEKCDSAVPARGAKDVELVA